MVRLDLSKGIKKHLQAHLNFTNWNLGVKLTVYGFGRVVMVFFSLLDSEFVDQLSTFYANPH